MERVVDSSNLAYLEALYQDFRSNPDTVPAEWRGYFAALAAEPSPNGLAASFASGLGKEVLPAYNAEFLLKAERLVQAYRERGHLAAKIDPLERPRPGAADLEASYYGLTPSDLELPLPPFFGAPTLAELIAKLKAAYCGSVGVELAHLDDPELRRFVESRVEGGFSRPAPDVQKRVHERLMQASLFEEFLQRKYLGAKTFSLEGNEALIPLLDFTLEGAARRGVVEVVMGMAHRGRLNVLANVLKEPFRKIVLQFEEAFPEGYLGDVKYHLGYSGDVETPAGKLHVSLNFNPSHLEFVAPVAMGRVRAKQDRFGDRERTKGLLVLIHGDAALIGEGIVQETLNISGLPAYSVGGALHIVVNNQIGFTTEPSEYTAGRYSTEIAKILQAPIFHVNAEDPEALMGVVELALEFRRQYQRDVFIDLVGFRRKGHNETEEPAYTQPDMYRRVAAKPPAHKSYLEKLEKEGIRTQAEAEALAKEFQAGLEAEFAEARRTADTVRPPAGGGVWSGYRGGADADAPDVDTGVPLEKLRSLAEPLTRLPQAFKLNPKLAKLVETRRAMFLGQKPLDWASAEILAFATLAAEGHRVRMSGQDVVRGTFTQRHAGLTDMEALDRYIPLQHLAEGQAPVELYNSALSEAGVLGFEYGYSLDMPDSLVVWEAQFGDFVNAAQVIIDQFISSAEAKWSRLSGIVLLLPHGLEGQGPEHSSARLERFLQLCSNDNIQVVYPTTPAQYFHLLRRQVKRSIRKPLVVMTPKSLLRNPEAVSPLEELSKGAFQRVISERVINPSRILLTSGKVYFDLLAKRKEVGADDVAVVRLEQFYPFPEKDLEAALAAFPAKIPVVWVQEEPANMGAWWFLRTRFCDGIYGRPFNSVSRADSPSPAVGSSKVHRREQEALVATALGV